MWNRGTLKERLTPRQAERRVSKIERRWATSGSRTRPTPIVIARTASRVDMGRVTTDLNAYEAALSKARFGWRRMRAMLARRRDVLMAAASVAHVERCTYQREPLPGQRMKPAPCGGRMGKVGVFTAARGAKGRPWLECRTCGRRRLAPIEAA